MSGCCPDVSDYVVLRAVTTTAHLATEQHFLTAPLGMKNVHTVSGSLKYAASSSSLFLMSLIGASISAYLPSRAITFAAAAFGLGGPIADWLSTPVIATPAHQRST